MKDWYTGSCILILGVCVLMTALPDYRKMDRKDKYLRGCMEMQMEKYTKRDEWMRILTCERMWQSQ